MPTVITASEYLEVNGVPLATPAWRLDTLAPLLSDNDLRGTDRVIPGAVGVRAKRRRRTVTVLTFGLHVFGEHDLTGAVYSNARQGLIDNVAYLKANLGAGGSTVTSIWHQPSGATKTVALHPYGPHDPEKRTPTWTHFMLDLSIPTGWWA